MSVPYDWDGHFWSRQIVLPFQERPVQIRIDTDSNEEPPTARQMAVADCIPEYLAGIKRHLDARAEQNCRKVDYAVNLEEEGIPINYDRIGDHYTIETALVGYVDGCEGNYFFLGCECDWEEEHGLEFLLDGSRILYCYHHTGTFIMTKSDEIYRRLASELGG
jgi:hypothetical protein